MAYLLALLLQPVAVVEQVDDLTRVRVRV